MHRKGNADGTFKHTDHDGFLKTILTGMHQ